MAEKENKKHKSTIDKYFSRTADGFKAWAEEDEQERNYLLVAIEPTGDVDEDGNQSYDLHIAYHGSTNFLASGIAQTMRKDEFLRQLICEATDKYFLPNEK